MIEKSSDKQIPKSIKSQKNVQYQKNTKNSIIVDSVTVPKRKKYRGRGKSNKRKDTFSILLVNMRGFKSKELSLKKVIRRMQPNMVTLNETMLTGNMKVAISPYIWWSKNIKDYRGRGGQRRR